MYYLNNKEIDFEKIVDLSLNDLKDRWFINIKTGKLKKNLKRGTWTEDYYEIPKVSSSERFYSMKEYAETMMEDEEMADKILFFLKKNDFDKAKETMRKTEDYKYYGFQTWEEISAADFIFDWISDLPVDFREEWDYDCDCPICMAMQEADKKGREMNFSDTIDAFKKANRLYPERSYMNPKFIEEELITLIKGKNITLGDIKKKIYEEGVDGENSMESSKNYNEWWMKEFDLNIDAVSHQKILDIFTDAWNYFPHKSLNGKSPHEVVLNSQKRSQSNL